MARSISRGREPGAVVVDCGVGGSTATQWNPVVTDLKQLVIHLGKEEENILQDAREMELKMVEEVELVEDEYTKQMEVIREADLQDKDALLRKYAKKRRINNDERHDILRERSNVHSQLLAQKEEDLKERLTEREGKLRQQFSMEIEEYEREIEQLERAHEEMMRNPPSNHYSRRAKPLGHGARGLGLELTTVPRAGAGDQRTAVKVIKSSGPALEADLRPGDVITNLTLVVDIKTRADVGQMLAGCVPTEPTMITSLRDGQEVKNILVLKRAGAGAA